MKTYVINGITVHDETPEYTGEELVKRATEVAEGMLWYAKQLEKKGILPPWKTGTEEQYDTKRAD